jgi:beta-lactamase class D
MWTPEAVRAAFLLTSAALVAAACASSADTSTKHDAAPVAREVDLSHHFRGIDPLDATFVVLDDETGNVTRYNPERARRRFLPASTFKIANALIALETGVASDAEFMLAYDSTAHRGPGFWAESWSRDHTLRSAMRNSVYWYYQEIARGVGAERMQRYLDQFDYGNRDMNGGVDRFWLHGDLRISPDEQVRFLQRMHRRELGASERATRILQDILVLEDSGEYRLSGKTGTADVTPTREMAWLVGYVERGEHVSYFALNVEGEQVWEQWGQPARRLELVRALLRELAAIPSGTE